LPTIATNSLNNQSETRLNHTQQLLSRNLQESTIMKLTGIFLAFMVTFLATITAANPVALADPQSANCDCGGCVCTGCTSRPCFSRYTFLANANTYDGQVDPQRSEAMATARHAARAHALYRISVGRVVSLDAHKPFGESLGGQL